MTPRQFLPAPPPTPPLRPVFGVVLQSNQNHRRAPLSRPSLPFSLSFGLPPKTAVPGSCTHAHSAQTHSATHPSGARTHSHTRTQTRARTPRRRLPLYISNSPVQSACSLSIIHAALEDGAAGAASAVISSPSPNLTKHRMMLPRDSAPFAATNYFPGVAY